MHIQVPSIYSETFHYRRVYISHHAPRARLLFWFCCFCDVRVRATALQVSRGERTFDALADPVSGHCLSTSQDCHKNDDESLAAVRI